ncbi:MAG: hypothetical protein ACRC1K_16820 [Planctomycetia bacterium]
MYQSSDADTTVAGADGGVQARVDHRLYVSNKAWTPYIHASDDRIFCFLTNPGEMYHHRITAGELYVARGDERLCLNCAARRGLLSNRRPSLAAGVEFGVFQTSEDEQT